MVSKIEVLVVDIAYSFTKFVIDVLQSCSVNVYRLASVMIVCSIRGLPDYMVD